MNIQSLSDSDLLHATSRLVKAEREILILVLRHLSEIQRRRLFADLKFGSLFDYTVKSLGYTEDEAYRRIAAMRLMNELPEVEVKIATGGLKLTQIGLAQKLFRAKAQDAHSKDETETRVKAGQCADREDECATDMGNSCENLNESAFGFTGEDKRGLTRAGGPGFSREEKLAILAKLENKSKRESEKLISEIAPEVLSVRESIRVLADNEVELRFIVDAETIARVEKLKGLHAHRNPNMTMAQLFSELCKVGVEKWDKLAAPRLGPVRVTRCQKSAAQVRREILRKDEGKCQNCQSTFALEVDHVWPKAKGGKWTQENLRTLCRSCNQRSAVKHFGAEKMQPYLERSMSVDRKT